MQLKHLSYSSLSLLQSCGEAWRRHYLEGERGPVGPALPFGSAFHDAIEHSIVAIAEAPDFTDDIVREMPQAFENRYRLHVEEAGEVQWDDTSFEEELVLGRTMLNSPSVHTFVKGFQLRTVERDGALWPLVETKIELQVPGVDVPIIGFIDLITADGIPVDLKTSSRRWGQYRADNEMQATVYLAAMQQMGAKLNPGMKFQYVVFVKRVPTIVEVITTQRTPADFQKMNILIKSLWDQLIKKEAFPLSGIGTWKCDPKYCGFYERCFNEK